jgi:outer membrane protein OmpA-like peptidoglycan-associated protein
VTPALSLLEPVHFETNRADITGDERAVVSRNAALLCAHPEALVTLVGHCDPRGSDAYNDTLGMMRAEATERALVSAGVPAERLKTESAGERQTVAATPDEYWQDRRVEFILK